MSHRKSDLGIPCREKSAKVVLVTRLKRPGKRPSGAAAVPGRLPGVKSFPGAPGVTSVSPRPHRRRVAPALPPQSMCARNRGARYRGDFDARSRAQHRTGRRARKHSARGRRHRSLQTAPVFSSNLLSIGSSRRIGSSRWFWQLQAFEQLPALPLQQPRPPLQFGSSSLMRWAPSEP